MCRATSSRYSRGVVAVETFWARVATGAERYEMPAMLGGAAAEARTQNAVAANHRLIVASTRARGPLKPDHVRASCESPAGSERQRQWRTRGGVDRQPRCHGPFGR